MQCRNPLCWFNHFIFPLILLVRKNTQQWNVIVSKVGTSHTVIARKLIQSQPRVQIYRGPKKVAIQRSSAYCKSAHSRIAPCTHYLNPINDNLTKSFWLPYSRQPLGLSSVRHHGTKLFLKSFFYFNTWILKAVSNIVFFELLMWKLKYYYVSFDTLTYVFTMRTNLPKLLDLLIFCIHICIH